MYNIQDQCFLSLTVRHAPDSLCDFTGIHTLRGRDHTNTWVLIENGGWINSLYTQIQGDINQLPLMNCINDQ